MLSATRIRVSADMNWCDRKKILQLHAVNIGASNGEEAIERFEADIYKTHTNDSSPVFFSRL